MSVRGTKRTNSVATMMSSTDPERTSAARLQRWLLLVLSPAIRKSRDDNWRVLACAFNARGQARCSSAGLEDLHNDPQVEVPALLALRNSHERFEPYLYEHARPHGGRADQSRRAGL